MPSRCPCNHDKIPLCRLRDSLDWSQSWNVGWIHSYSKAILYGNTPDVRRKMYRKKNQTMCYNANVNNTNITYIGRTPIDGLVQHCSNPSALSMGLLQFTQSHQYACKFLMDGKCNVFLVKNKPFVEQILEHVFLWSITLKIFDHHPSLMGFFDSLALTHSQLLMILHWTAEQSHRALNEGNYQHIEFERKQTKFLIESG